MRIIGLTGPIGAGKSAVAAVWRAQGVPVIDADALAREVMYPGSPCLRELAAAFGGDILRGDGTLDRGLLAARAFATPETAARLSAVTHPHIIALTRTILTALAAEGRPLAVLEAPLLPGSGLEPLCGDIVTVDAPEEVRVRRVMARGPLTEADARARVAAQPPAAVYRAAASRILPGGGSLEALREAAAALLRELTIT